MIALQIPGNKLIFIFYVKPLASIQLKLYQRNENKIIVSPAVTRRHVNVLAMVFKTFSRNALPSFRHIKWTKKKPKILLSPLDP